jgi:uncharacterized membrane protein YfcA
MTGVVLYASLVGFGFFTGGAAGLLGVGGGIMMVPFLTLVAGVSQHAAQATSLLVVLPTAVVATIVLHRRGVGDPALALRFGAIGAVGGVVGALLALALPGQLLRLIFAAFLLVVAVRLVRDGVTSR